MQITVTALPTSVCVCVSLSLSLSLSPFPPLKKFSLGAENASKLNLAPLFATRPPLLPVRRYQPSPFQTGSAGAGVYHKSSVFERSRVSSFSFFYLNATVSPENSVAERDCNSE